MSVLAPLWSLTASVVLASSPVFVPDPSNLIAPEAAAAAVASVRPSAIVSDPARGAFQVGVSFDLTAELLEAENGDLYLDFGAICEMVWNAEEQRDECTFPNRYIHYSLEAKVTTGWGVLFGEGDDGSVWTIDLSQIHWTGETSLLDGDFGSLIAEEVGGAERAGTAGLGF